MSLRFHLVLAYSQVQETRDCPPAHWPDRSDSWFTHHAWEDIKAASRAYPEVRWLDVVALWRAIVAEGARA